MLSCRQPVSGPRRLVPQSRAQPGECICLPSFSCMYSKVCDRAFISNLHSHNLEEVSGRCFGRKGAYQWQTRHLMGSLAALSISFCLRQASAAAQPVHALTDLM